MNSRISAWNVSIYVHCVLKIILHVTVSNLQRTWCLYNLSSLVKLWRQFSSPTLLMHLGKCFRKDNLPIFANLLLFFRRASYGYFWERMGKAIAYSRSINTNSPDWKRHSSKSQERHRKNRSLHHSNNWSNRYFFRCDSRWSIQNMSVLQNCDMLTQRSLKFVNYD